MALPRETPFTAFDFSNEEIKHAMQFNETQKQYLQTMLAEVALQKLAEAFDAANPVKFAQMEAYTRGQMDILNVLLAEQEFDSEDSPYDTAPDPATDPATQAAPPPPAV